ncbi:MAG: hypothetical protein Q9159_002996 [Coniocarpon cinnabarinum]
MEVVSLPEKQDVVQDLPPRPVREESRGLMSIFFHSWNNSEPKPVKQDARLEFYIKLDRALFVGPHDPITGIVVVRCTQLHGFAGELFGPLSISVMLSGRTKTRLTFPGSSNSYSCYGQADLFKDRKRTYNDSFTTKVTEEHQFPFSISFPTTLVTSRSAYIPERFLHPDGCQLPPSMFAKHPEDELTGYGVVEYELTASVWMPNLPKVRVTPACTPVMVSYRQKHLQDQRVTAPPVRMNQLLYVSNAFLLPEGSA